MTICQTPVVLYRLEFDSVCSAEFGYSRSGIVRLSQENQGLGEENSGDGPDAEAKKGRRAGIAGTRQRLI